MNYHSAKNADMLSTKPTNFAQLKVALLMIWNALPREFTDKPILPFATDFNHTLLQMVDISSQVKSSQVYW